MQSLDAKFKGERLGFQDSGTQDDGISLDRNSVHMLSPPPLYFFVNQEVQRQAVERPPGRPAPVHGHISTIRYDRWFALENWQASCPFNLPHKLKKTLNVLNGTKKVKNKNQETDGYGRDKRPNTEKLKRKEITITGKKSELMLMRRATASV